METVEFRTSPDGKVYYKPKGKDEKRLTKFSREILSPLSEIIRLRFPECYSRLITLYPTKNHTQDSRDIQTLHIVDRFIRCNFGEHDLLTQDIENEILHFEEVRCPLRGGLCPHENVICRPKGLIRLTPAEKEVVNLYLEGVTFKDIASILNKKASTVKTQLFRIKEKLNVKNCREIIRVLRLNNY
jgi:DNA-binding CsgD family transcriptional regulator